MKRLTKKRKIQYRIRKKVSGTPTRPRLSVYRSNRGIYCQLIDDINGVTMASASSKDESVDQSKTKREQANQVGKLISEKAKSLDLQTVVFDRSGYIYHGRIKALAEGAREGGLNF